MGDLTRLPLDDGGWRDFVEAHGDATPFHEPAKLMFWTEKPATLPPHRPMPSLALIVALAVP